MWDQDLGLGLRVSIASALSTRSGISCWPLQGPESYGRASRKTPYDHGKSSRGGALGYGNLKAGVMDSF